MVSRIGSSCLILVGLLPLAAGCGPGSQDTPPPSTAPPSTAAAARSPIAPSPGNAEGETLTLYVDTPAAQSAELQVTPASAAQTIRAIDLRKLPRLNSKQVINDSATSLYYSAASSVAAAAGFYQSELESQGWKLMPDSIPDNPQYRDMLFAKEGFYLRLTLGASGDEGIVGVNISNLGNVNLLGLPRIDNAEPHPSSTPVNVSYETQQGMPEAVQFCRDKLAEAGWIPCGDMYSNPTEVPHVKQLNYSRNAIRIMVNVIRDPRLPNVDKTMVSYFAMDALPYDIPVIRDATSFKLDTIGGRASYETTISVSELVDYYRGLAPQLSWKLRPEDDDIREDHASLYVQDENELGFAIAISKDKELTKVAFQRLSFRETDEPSNAPSPPVDTTADVQPQEDERASEVDESIENLQREIQGTVKKELQGIQDELKKLGVDIPDSILSLDALSEDDVPSTAQDDAPDITDTSNSLERSREVTEQLKAADVELTTLPKLKTLCTITYGEKTFELKHALAVRSADDDKTPTIMFCQEPLNADKATRQLARGEDVTVLDLIGNRFPAAIEIRLQPDFTFISCFVDGASINRGSSDFKSDFKSGSRRLRGTVSMTEPEDVFDKLFHFEASFDQDLLSAEVNASDIADADLLVADADYELPVPEDCAGVSQERSPYRTTITAEIEAPLARVLEFYQRELTKSKWVEDIAKSQSDATSSRLVFRGDSGPLSLSLQHSDDRTAIELTTRNEQKARRDGIVPAVGQGLLLFANAGEKEVVMTLNKRTIRLAAGSGAQDPTQATKVPVLPGKHRILMGSGGGAKREEVVVDEGATWGIVAIPEGEMFIQVVY